jgi:competence ComEA-like helix-hairpin-helix protein
VAVLFTPDERRAILAVLGLLTLGLVVRLVQRGPVPPDGGGDSLLVVLAHAEGLPAAGAAPPPGIGQEGRIRINLASEADLMRLPGIGPALARRIRDARLSGGPFASAEDIQRVKGIGPKLAARIRPMVSFAVDSTPPGASGSRVESGDSAGVVGCNGELHPATPDSGEKMVDGSEP